MLKLLLPPLFIFLYSFTLHSFEVTHQVRPGSVYESTALNSACSTMLGTTFSGRCNPALFSYSKDQKVYLSLVGKADGDSIDNGRDLIFDPITEETIRKLLQERNFNSFTFNSELVFKTKYFEIAYSPYYLLADLYIFNPAFPEISIHLVNQETLRLTSGHEFLNNKELTLSIGSSLFYYEHTYSNTIFSLFELSYRKPEELIPFKTLYGVSGDLGFFVDLKRKYLPRLALQMKNIHANRPKVTNTSSTSPLYQETLFLFEPYTTMGIGKGWMTKFGAFDVDFELPFTRYLQTARLKHSMLGARYNLNLFSIFLGVGYYYHNLGLRFDSQNFNVGITYTKESDMGALQPKTEESVYLGVDFIL
ncbi:MAG: hypothetical protein HQK52_20900 [Oligoflexia bacterium]|nr:hypothetical protein [Oligoflexia bacterium]